MIITFMSKNAVRVTFRVNEQEAEILMALFSKIPDSEFISRPVLEQSR